MSFAAAVTLALQNHGYKPRSPNELLRWWQQFLEQCEDGYPSSIYEYDDEICVRDYIESVLNDVRVASYGEFTEFELKVRGIDERFRKLFQPDVKRPWPNDVWWRAGILRFACEEYCQDILSRYSIPVDETE